MKRKLTMFQTGHAKFNLTLLTFHGTVAQFAVLDDIHATYQHPDWVRGWQLAAHQAMSGGKITLE
jgi:hypothetical protein